VADGVCLACEHLPCTCGRPNEIERAHALLAGIIGQRGETLDATVELVRAYILNAVETNAILAQRVLELERKLGEIP
jgi:hypothetical protein